MELVTLIMVTLIITIMDILIIIIGPLTGVFMSSFLTEGKVTSNGAD